VYSGASNTGTHVKDERQTLVVRETVYTDGETVGSEQTGSHLTVLTSSSSASLSMKLWPYSA